MKKIIHLLTFASLLTSCSSTKNYSHSKDAENDLQNMVQTLNKTPGNESARKALPVLYAETKQFHLSNIETFRAASQKGSIHWNDIILEYQALQNSYNLIKNSAGANLLVSPTNYESNIRQTKEEAGKYFYQLAESLLRKGGRKNSLQALAYFKVCDYYFPGYENVKSMISTAYQKTVINIVVDSLEDHSYFIKVDPAEKGFVSFNDLFQQNLKKILQDDFLNGEKPVAFYTNKEAATKNVRVDWIINLDLIKMSTSVSNALSGNAPLAPGGYVAENVMTYIIPNYSAQTGSEPLRLQYFGNNDVFTYPSPPSSLANNPNNYNVFIDGTLSAKIMDDQKRRDIFSRTIYARSQLPKAPTHYAEQIASHNASLEKLFVEFYPQIVETIEKALN